MLYALCCSLMPQFYVLLAYQVGFFSFPVYHYLPMQRDADFESMYWFRKSLFALFYSVYEKNRTSTYGNDFVILNFIKIL